MEIQSVSGDEERRVLGMTLGYDVILQDMSIYSRDRSDVLLSSISNKIIRWAIDYYKTYAKAPGADVEGCINELKAKNDPDSTQVELCLQELQCPQTDNVEYLRDIVRDYVEKVRLRKLAQTIDGLASRGDVDACYSRLMQLRRLTNGQVEPINPFIDDDRIRDAFQDESMNSLINFTSKDAEEFFGSTFSRSAFVLINASEKMGKSTLLIDLTVRALEQNKKVAYFEAGDMSWKQVFRRFYSRVARKPIRGGSSTLPIEPFAVELSDRGEAHYIINHETVHYDDMTPEEAVDACKYFNENSEGGIQCRFSSHPQDLTLSRMLSILDEWERNDNFIPDFVVLDYVDLIVPEGRNLEYRHQINEIFSRLRRISLERNCCVITATQAKRGGSMGDSMDVGTIAEDKRKAAHPTAILGLSAGEYERQNHIARLNYLVRRDGPCDSNNCLYLAQALDLCQPMYLSYYPAYRDRVEQVKKQSKKGKEYRPSTVESSVPKGSGGPGDISHCILGSDLPWSFDSMG